MNNLLIYYGMMDDKNRILKKDKAVSIASKVVHIFDTNLDKTQDEKLKKVVTMIKKVLK